MIRCDALFFVSAFFFKALYDSEQAPLSSFAYHTNTRIDCLQKGPTVQPLFSQTGTLVISFFTLSFSRFPLVSLAHFKEKKYLFPLSLTLHTKQPPDWASLRFRDTNTPRVLYPAGHPPSVLLDPRCFQFHSNNEISPGENTTQNTIDLFASLSLASPLIHAQQIIYQSRCQEIEHHVAPKPKLS